MIVYIFIANKMMRMLKEDNASYQWMYLTKVPLSQQKGDHFLVRYRNMEESTFVVFIITAK